MSKNFSFAKADIEIRSPKKLEQTKFKGFEGYFDPNDGRYYLSKKAHPNEYVIDLENQKIIKFPAQ